MAVKIMFPLSAEILETRRILGDAENLHGKVDAIQLKTDNLPVDTASSLSTLTSNLETVDTVVDAIKAKTDNLPADTATALSTIDTVVDSIKAVTDLLPDAGALSSLAQDSTVAKDATVAKAADLATVDSVVDAIKAVTDLLPDAGALTSLATAAALATVDTVVDGIQSDLDNSTDGLGALKTLIDSVQSSVSAIQNNTRLTTSIAQEVDIPETGSVYNKFFVNLYDTSANKEDPDSDDIAVVLTSFDGTDLTATRCFKTATGTALDASTEFSGLAKLAKDSTGRYYFFYKSTSTDTPETLNVQLRYKEATVENNADRSLRVVEELGDAGATLANQQTIISDIADVQSDVTAIKAKTDNFPADLATDLATIDTVVDAIKAVTDLLPDAGALTSLATAADLAVVDGNVDAIKAKTDNLPADTAAILGTPANVSLAQDIADLASDLASKPSYSTTFGAVKTTASLAQGASEVLQFSTAEGVITNNSKLAQLKISVTGACSNFTVQIFEKTGTPLANKIYEIQQGDANGINIDLNYLIFRNADAVATNVIYINIISVADAGSSSFSVELRGELAS